MGVEVDGEGAAVKIRWDGEGKFDTTYSQSWLAKRNMAHPEVGGVLAGKRGKGAGLEFHRTRRFYHKGTDSSEHWSAEKGEELIGDPAYWPRLLQDTRYLRSPLRRALTGTGG